LLSNQNERDGTRTRNHRIDSPGANSENPGDSSQSALCLRPACQTLHPADLPSEVLLMHFQHMHLAMDPAFREVLSEWQSLLPIDRERILSTARGAALRQALAVWENEGGKPEAKSAG